MVPKHPLFAPYEDFLEHSLHASYCSKIKKKIKVTTGTLELIGSGCMLLQPKISNDSQGLILSAGIHGNETAPIELINQLVNQVLNEHISIGRPTLVILGNPAAMQVESRFIDFNLNRLFNGEHLSETYCHYAEAQRAADIEKWVCEFNDQFKLTEHFDFHTAIRSSCFERFALYPFHARKTSSEKHKAFLANIGVQALVHQKSSSNTFSSFTMSQFGCESYTIELGKVNTFGQNDLASYQDVSSSLAALLEAKGEDVKSVSNNDLIQEYEATHEIIKTEDDFILNVEDDVSNFTAYAQGTEIWKDRNDYYTVVADQEYIIFPNKKVANGQRAGIMLKRV